MVVVSFGVPSSLALASRSRRYAMFPALCLSLSATALLALFNNLFWSPVSARYARVRSPFSARVRSTGPSTRT